MKFSNALAVLATLGFAVIPSGRAIALPPPAAPFTLWNFLGIPQGFNKIRDATTNRRGNRPGMERKPPMKALADPQNLMSPNPAIAKAAEIKTQEDMAPQKIKAIKYLASVGCGCYAGVKEALLAALDDCTEEVRYQTVLAIEDAAGAQCETCGQGCCCDEELTTKLSQIAYEKTDKCCWLESSERVREAAKRAMCACCPNQGGPEEIPAETAPVQGGDETIPREPTPPAPEAVPSARRTAPNGASMIVTGTRVQGAGSHVTPSQSDAIVSDEGEIEEIVTVEFGGTAPQTARTAPAAGSPSARRVITPATTRKPAAMNKKSASAAPAGQSSRRSAAERGLATPGQANQPATVKAPAVQQASAEQPATTTPVETKASAPVKQSAGNRQPAAPAPSMTMLKALPWVNSEKSANTEGDQDQASVNTVKPVAAFRTVLD